MRSGAAVALARGGRGAGGHLGSGQKGGGGRSRGGSGAGDWRRGAPVRQVAARRLDRTPLNPFPASRPFPSVLLSHPSGRAQPAAPTWESFPFPPPPPPSAAAAERQATSSRGGWGENQRNRAWQLGGARRSRGADPAARGCRQARPLPLPRGCRGAAGGGGEALALPGAERFPNPRRAAASRGRGARGRAVPERGAGGAAWASLRGRNKGAGAAAPAAGSARVCSVCVCVCVCVCARVCVSAFACVRACLCGAAIARSEPSAGSAAQSRRSWRCFRQGSVLRGGRLRRWLRITRTGRNLWISDPASVHWFATFTTTVEQLRDFLEIPTVYSWQMLAVDAEKVVLCLGITFKEGRTHRLPVPCLLKRSFENIIKLNPGTS
ncbi:uncharacterized protein [Excalfactoria chinensis]|uniref:uncharacterized protein n=1 Tax=Excalfactoria chinensis TaxID=46218 RepID=UPI003B3A264D